MILAIPALPSGIYPQKFFETQLRKSSASRGIVYLQLIQHHILCNSFSNLQTTIKRTICTGDGNRPFYSQRLSGQLWESGISHNQNHFCLWKKNKMKRSCRKKKLSIQQHTTLHKYSALTVFAGTI